MRVLNDGNGIIIDLSFDEIIRFANEMNVTLTYKETENWLNSNRTFIHNCLKQAIKTDIARLNRKWP